MDADSAIKINEINEIDYLYKYLEEVQKTKIIVENYYEKNIGKPNYLEELQWNKMNLNNKIQTFVNIILLYV